MVGHALMHGADEVRAHVIEGELEVSLGVRFRACGFFHATG